MGKTFARQRTLPHRAIDKDVYALAVERTELTFDRFDYVSVMFSGGKDSTAVLNVALEVAERRGRTPIDVVFFDEEAIPYETEDYVRRVAADPRVSMRWLCLPVRHRNACSRRSPWWFPWAPEDEALWTRPLPPEAIVSLPNIPNEPAEKRMAIPEMNGLLYDFREVGTVGMLMGIRAQESITRNAALSRRRDDNWIIPYIDITDKGSLFKCYPIYDWQTEDVWTAPAVLEWDYNRAYDRMEQAGVSHSSQRCAPPYGEEPMRGLWVFQVCFPELWDKMVDRVPGAAAAARYATSELYAYRTDRDGIGKPPSESWEDFLTKFLRKYPVEEARFIADRMRREIARHFSLTNEPILDEVPHPASGLSWMFLAKLAMRGDFKSRRKVLADIVTRSNEENEARYAEALTEWRSVNGNEVDAARSRLAR